MGLPRPRRSPAVPVARSGDGPQRAAWSGDRVQPVGGGPQGATSHCERFGIAVMRARWARTDLRLTVACPRSGVQTELVCGRQVLWSGRWDVEVLRDGQRIEPDGPWQETCWLSDKSVDYLELQLGCRGGIRVDRHILLAKRDRFLFLADAVLGRRRAELHYRASVPLGDRAFFQGAKQSREGCL